MQSFANISELASSHTADRYRFRGYVEITTGLACLLSIGVLVTVYSRAKVVTQSKGSRKPKAYFQFWAFHVFAINFMILTVTQNINEIQYRLLAILIWVAISGTVIGIVSLTKFDIETPTHFCRCCHGFSHCIVLWMSLCTSLLFISFVLFSIPTIILVYYLYPARTLLRLPLLTNAVLYINSLLALLLFQCERLFYPCVRNSKPQRIRCRDIMGYCARFRILTEENEEQEKGVVHSKKNCSYKYHCYNRYCLGHWCMQGVCDILKLYIRLAKIENPPLEDRAVVYRNFYATHYNKELLEKKDCLMFTTYLCHPIGTMILLAILILFVIIIHNLTDLHLSSVKDLNLNLLLTLAPTLLLLFVSWYKFDIFYDLKDEEEKSEKEILKEILKQEKLILEKIHPSTEQGAGIPYRLPDASDTTQNDTTPTRPDREANQKSELAQLDTAHTARDTDTTQATGDTAQATRPDATRDVVATPFATESDITPATGGEATGSAVSGETIPLLIVNYKR